MEHHPLLALSPLDGRYATKLEAVRQHFSEYALIKYRVFVEIEWFKSLAAEPKIKAVPALCPAQIKALNALVENFDLDQALLVKAFEQQTNHDVKAVEYYLKQRLSALAIEPIEFIHFACTSEDITNLAYALMLKAGRDRILQPHLDAVIVQLSAMATAYAETPMLARTHGQAASPTTLGKEIANVVARLSRQQQQLESQVFLGKLNGAVGNYSAHHIAYPDIDWPKHAQCFIERLGLTFNAFTTQIEPHDAIAELCDCQQRINTILLDLCRDCWSYISLGYFQQRAIAEEVGSSTMPHKINPIDFENAEGNLGVANALLQFFSQKLPISRWQRDLSDSTTLRNLGSAIGYTELALQSVQRGLNKLSVNTTRLADDLATHWDVLAEPIQTIMRKHGIEQPYEKLKNFTRGKAIDQTAIQAFIYELELPETVKAELLALRPETYIGLAAELARQHGDK